MIVILIGFILMWSVFGGALYLLDTMTEERPISKSKVIIYGPFAWFMEMMDYTQ